MLHCQTCHEKTHRTYKRQPKQMTCPTCKTRANTCLTEDDYYVNVYKASTSSGYANEGEYVAFNMQCTTHEIRHSDVKTDTYDIEIRLAQHDKKTPKLYMIVNTKPLRNITYGSLPYFAPKLLYVLLEHSEIKPHYDYFVQNVFRQLKRKWYPSYELPSLAYLGFFIVYPALLYAPPEFVKEWIDEYIEAPPDSADSTYQPQYERSPNLRFDNRVKKQLQTCSYTFRDVLNIYGWHETSDDVAHFMKQHTDTGDLYRLVTYLFKDQATQLRVLMYLTAEFDAEKARILQTDGEGAWFALKRKIRDQLYYFYLCASYKWATINETTYQYKQGGLYNAYISGEYEHDYSSYALCTITPPLITLRPLADGDLYSQSEELSDYIQSETQTTLKRATSHLTDEQIQELTYLTYNSLKPYNQASSVLYPNVFYRKGATIYNKAQGLPPYFQEHERILADYLTDTFAKKPTYFDKLKKQTTFIAELIHMHDLVVYHEKNPYLTFDFDLDSHDIYAFYRELYCRATAYTTTKIGCEVRANRVPGWSVTTHTTMYSSVDITGISPSYGLASIQHELDPCQMVATANVVNLMCASPISDNIRALRLILAPYDDALYIRHHRVSKNGYTSYIVESIDQLVKSVLCTKKYDTNKLSTFVDNFFKKPMYLYTYLVCNQTGKIVAVGQWRKLNKNSTIAHFMTGIYHDSIKQSGDTLMITSVRN